MGVGKHNKGESVCVACEVLQLQSHEERRSRDSLAAAHARHRRRHAIAHEARNLETHPLRLGARDGNRDDW